MGPVAGGKPTHGPPTGRTSVPSRLPWRYRVDRENSFLEVNPEEAPLVPVMFDLYLNRRLGARNIANWLNERGHRTRGGKP
jgi:hypothetical protein